MNYRKNFIRATCIFILLFVILSTLIVMFSSCGNKAIIDPGNFNFTHVHISDHTESHCFEITKWWNNETGIEVKLKNGNGIFCSEGTYQLFESSEDCPYCK